MKTLGETLRELREKKGLLLRQVAAAIEVDTALMSKYERDERKPTKEQVLQLAKFYNADKDNLLIQYLSDKVVYDLQEEDLASEALKVAEKKINYIKKEKNGKS